jgi:SAM-dependent methyltransferase
MRTYVSLKNTHRFELPPECQNDDVLFSESLVEHFLREFTREGDVIFDPFAGYGTTLLVAEEMGRIPYGIEFDAQRVAYTRSKLKHPNHLIHGDSRQLASYNLPPFDFSITSPPYMGKHDRENPFTNYSSQGSYDAYLQDIRSIYKQVRQMMKSNARIVIEVTNLKLWDGLTTLAWDVAEAVSRVFRFEGEIIVGWDRYGFGYDHSYCLVFAEPKGEMDLHLAVALSGTDPDCRIRFLDSGVCLDARRSEPMIEHNIVVKPDQLIVVDANADPPQVVYRWPFIETKDGRILTEDGESVDLDRLRADFFPRIHTMYERMEAWRELNPKQVIEEGYDCIAERYLEWTQTARSEERARYTSVLLDELPLGAKVLDLGCGAGVPTTRELAQRFNVTGVDISARQIALAQQNVPEAHFIQADITQLDFPPASFDAVVAFYSIIHVPRQEQSKLLQAIASWLRPGGLLVTSMGIHSIKADYAEDFLGAPMYWSSFDSETNRRLVNEAGLHIVSAREETAEEFDQPVTFLWIIARKPLLTP